MLVRCATLSSGLVLVVHRGGAAHAETVGDPNSLPATGGGAAQWIVITLLVAVGVAMLMAVDRLHRGTMRRRSREPTA